VERRGRGEPRRVFLYPLSLGGYAVDAGWVE